MRSPDSLGVQLLQSMREKVTKFEKFKAKKASREAEEGEEEQISLKNTVKLREIELQTKH